MNGKLPVLLVGLVCLSYTPLAIGQCPGPGTHDLSGPVRLLWEARYGGPFPDQVSSMAVSANADTVFVTGFSQLLPYSYESADFATVAYDAWTGEQVWAALHDGPASGRDHGQSVAVSPDGAKVFVTGVSNGLGTQDDCATLAYDAATGDEIWTARYDGPASGRDHQCVLSVSPDGGTLFVAADSEGVGTRSDYVVVAYDAATGSEVWVARYDGPSSLGEHTGRLTVSPSGGEVFVSGGSPCTECDTDCATVAYDASTGDELWVARYDGPGSLARDHCSHAAVSRDGATLFVAGWSDEIGTGPDYLVVAYDASTGDETWVAHYDGPALGGDGLRALQTTPDGSMVLVTGESESGGGDNDYATVAYDAATGAELWVSRYGGACLGWDRGNSVAALPDSSVVVVTGYSHGLETGGDYLTVAYEPTEGEQVWVARYDGLAPARPCDEGLAVLPGPDGFTVFVTGNSEGLDSGSDYATVAYLVVLPIDIDIKPENDTNPINPRAHGVTPVALLGSAEFDVTEVDVVTLRFGPGEAVPAHDLTDGWPYSDPLRDVNGDGFTDLLVHFATREAAIQCGDTEATLTGQLMDGFPIRGTDPIVTVGCRYAGGPSARTPTARPRLNPRADTVGLAERR